jgi:hypothetical protein
MRFPLPHLNLVCFGEIAFDRIGRKPYPTLPGPNRRKMEKAAELGEVEGFAGSATDILIVCMCSSP